jgi:glycosyltransferase involved in cell wall biosynthesis
MLGGDSGGPVLAIIAALDEEEGIGLTIAELQKYVKDSRVVVVDGKSQDRTVEVAKSLGAEVVVQRGSGKGNAIAQAIEEVKLADVQYVVLTDADYTYPAEYVPGMIRILDKNPGIGMVCGERFNTHSRLESFHDLFYLGNRALALAHSLVSGIDLRDPLTGLRVVRSTILTDWEPKSDGFDVEVELNCHVERQGYSIAETPICYRPRLGEKKLKLRHGLTILKRILTESLR